MLKKYNIKIPSNLKFVFCGSKNTISFVSSSGSIKTYQLKFKVLIDKLDNTIFITDQFFGNYSKTQFKNLKSYRCLEIALLRKLIGQLLSVNFKRLNLVGVGYRAFVQSDLNILNLKLGYSHPILIKFPSTLNVICPKPNTIFISGPCINQINKIVSVIRGFRTPEPYKGKGVLYEYEKLTLKEGKSKT